MRSFFTTASGAFGAAAMLALVLSSCGGSTTSAPGGGAGVGGTGASGGAGGGGGSGGSGASGGMGGDGGIGGSGAGGSGGTGGVEGPIVGADKVDLLVMVDNSASMADKQLVLAQTLPDLVNRLTNPDCVDPATRQFVARVNAGEPCPSESVREFPAVTDMHLGVITSSLGSHGADSCSNTSSSNYNPHQEDMAHLITRGEGAAIVPTYENKGYLNWDPKGASVPPGESDATATSQRFGELVVGAGQDGCGFEAQLEAWYRFLVDPAPYQKMLPVPCYDGDVGNNCRGPSGVDSVVLQQRADFLRDDSVVSIVMLTDEDDCSLMDGGQNFLALQALDGTSAFHMARGTAVCESDPGNAECMSCWAAGSSPYPECIVGWIDADKDDPLNLRCYRQKQRFGINFLNPVSRYVAALTSPTLEDGAPNALFCKNATGATCTPNGRDRTQVVLAGIVGVPWQDLANDPSDLSKGYKPAAEIPWAVVAGDVDNYVDPTDPFMKPSVAPRSGTNPITGAPISPPGSAYNANAINGHEWDIPQRNDLQYACVFDLPQPMDCAGGVCDCYSGSQSPLCQNPSTGQYGSTQYRAKAYPGVRHLGVLAGIGGQAVVGSICAPNLTAPSLGDYAYRPAISALVDRIGKNLSAP